MVLMVLISEEAQAKLSARAQAAGMDVETFAARTLERVVSRPSLDEVLAPIRESFKQSGMTDDELSDLLEEAKHEARAARRGRRTS
jgi:ribosomal protein L12E/L44/L45/RPP1/RPP2